MKGNFKGFLLTALSSFILCFAAWGQSRFVYIQSENGQPFYLKMNDTLLSSTPAGYLILPQLKKETYPVVIGYAKKEVPEAAFKITLDNSGGKGYMLDVNTGKPRLTDIQNKTILKPEEVALSAGNRILPSTLEKNIPEKPVQKKDTTPKLIVSNVKVSDVSKSQKKTAPKEPQLDSFAGMLNAVTGGSLASSSVSEETQASSEAGQTEEKEDTILKSDTNNSAPVAQADNISKDSVLISKTEEPSAFEKLLREENTYKKEENKLPPPTETAPPQVEKPAEEKPVLAEPKAKKQDLVFIDFKDIPENQQKDANGLIKNKDSIIVKTQPVEQAKNRIEKRISFDDLLAKIDTSTDTSSKSVAKPLLNENPSISESAVCNGVADQPYFDKIRRKVASKKGEESMLRAAMHSFSGDKCFLVSQLKQVAYLFSSDEYRLQFLKAGFQHCADKEHYKELLKTLSSKQYQKQLQDYIQ